MRTDRDPADLPQASAADHPADHLLEAYCPRCSRAVDAVCPDCGGNVELAGASAAAGSTLAQAEFYRRLVLLINGSRNAKFICGCYLIATGDAGAEGVSMADFGKAWGVTRAAVSKHCRRICRILEIPPSRYMRREETAAQFKISNRRPRKFL